MKTSFFVNLEYFSKLCYDKIEERDKLWKLFTIKEKDELEKLVDDEKELSKYRDKLYRLSKDEEYCKMVWDERIDTNLRRYQDYSDGKEDGIQEKTREMIIELKKNGVSLDVIAKSTKMDILEVKKIIESESK